jgi:DNA (cytosine-5)-methyltransferase 1
LTVKKKPLGDFQFIDLFAGVGGFHLALTEMGGECVFASEIDDQAALIYANNHPMKKGTIHGNIVPLTEPRVSQKIPNHQVLAAGFPCQPFSKSGQQKGIEDTRGTLFYNILKILQARKPEFVILENVKNLVGPKHLETWVEIKSQLRSLGYWISEKPTIYSPHLLPPELGGAPQNRERIYIVGKYVGKRRAQESIQDNFHIPNRAAQGWDPKNWNAIDFFSSNSFNNQDERQLKDNQKRSFEIWSDFVKIVGDMAESNRTLPGFPLWEFAFEEAPTIPDDIPLWKRRFLEQNAAFYRTNTKAIELWRSKHPELKTLPHSFRKFEWQAGSAKRMNQTFFQFRPSGLRVKEANYLPALVAINQTTYMPKLGRFLSVNEAASLQSFPVDFDFSGQSDELSFKQLGNAVSVSTVKYVLEQFLVHFEERGI